VLYYGNGCLDGYCRYGSSVIDLIVIRGFRLSVFSMVLGGVWFVVSLWVGV